MEGDKNNTSKGMHGFTSQSLPSRRTPNYGSLEEKEKEQQIEAKQEEQMRQLEQHCRRHNCSAYNSYTHNKFIHPPKPANKMLQKFNLRWLGVGLFVAASIFCLYQIWVISNEKPPLVKKKLLLVNIFSRHGDRAPSDKLPKGDRHAENVTLFWPDGLSNLTDAGKARSFKMGLVTRRDYNNYINFDSSQILAFSSTIYRCRASLQHFLMGLYNVEWTKAKGRALVSMMNNCTTTNDNQCKLSTGSGLPDEWKKIKIDTETVPTLSYKYLSNCKYRKENPSQIEANLMIDPYINQLPGVDKLRAVIKKRYDTDFNFTATSIWSTISSELNLIRTESTYNYTDHYNDWINDVVKRGRDYVITLYDVYEQVVVFCYRDRIVDIANYIQTGNIVTSIIESQLVALGHDSTNERMNLYRNKKMLLYASHDSVLQLLLSTIGLIDTEAPFEERFSRWHDSHDEVGKLLSGIKMCSFGMSIRFELWELESIVDGDKFHYVQLSIYNKEDGKFQDIEYKVVNFGTVCNKLFKKKYPNASDDEISSFYKSGIYFDKNRNCPFKLFRNVTLDLMNDERRVHQLCGQ